MIDRANAQWWLAATEATIYIILLGAIVNSCWKSDSKITPVRAPTF